MRTTVRLDDQLLVLAKQYATTHNKTFTCVMEEALREKLMRRPANRKIAPVKLKTVTGKGVNPGIDLDDSATLLDVMND